jgi:4-amino-4-deoxy-L-arabinose transferase-like glycosyltransferase
MPSPLSKKTVIVLLLLILLLGVGLRAFNVGHVLSWDEAWNVQTVLDGAKHMTGDVWFYNFYRHPPLYTGFGIALATIFGLDKTGIALSLEVISLLCALATMLLLFLCGRDWFDERVGLVAAFLYAVFPGARAFDVFIKPDSMTLLLGLLFLFFFFREKYLLAGVFLGLAFLAKETAVFIVIPAAVYVLVQWKRRQVIWLTLDGVIAVAMSAWWYLAYSVSKGDFLNFFIGRGTEAVDWKAPWHRYIGRLPADIGWVGVALLALAVVMFVWRPGEDRRRGKALLLVLWAGITYLFLTVSFGKPPWMIYTALPALALLGAWGLVRALRVLEFNKAAVAVAGAVLLLALALSVPVGFGGFMRKADPSFAGWINDKKVADYVNSRGGRRVMLSFNDLSPNLLYYLDSYDVKKLVTIPANARPDSTSAAGTVFVVGPGTPLQLEEQRIVAVAPDFVIARGSGLTVEGSEAQKLAALAALAPGKKFGAVFVFDGKKLAEKIHK